MKRYITTSFIYALIAMAGGVFFREFTKFNGFTSKTALGVVHTHYFLLGMVFFLILLMLEKLFQFTKPKTQKILIVYQVGLNIFGAMLLIRGILQVLGTKLDNGLDFAISGIAGIGHVLLGVSLILILLEIRKAVKENKSN